MIENYAAWQFWVNVAILIFNGGIGVYLWWDRRNKVTEKRFRVLEDQVVDHVSAILRIEAIEKVRAEKCDKHHTRTGTLESGLSVLKVNIHHLPSRQELSELSKQIGLMTEKLGKLDGRLSGINRAVDLLNQHHLQVGK